MLDEVSVEKDTSILWLDKSTVILAASLDAGNQALAADHLLRFHTPLNRRDGLWWCLRE